MAHRSLPQPPPGALDEGDLPPPGPVVAAVHPLGELVAHRLAGLRPSTLLGAVVAIVGLVVAGWWLVRPAAPPVEATLPAAQTSASGEGPSRSEAPAPGVPAGAGASTSTPVEEVVVQAAGAVRRPGVYRLGGGSRIDDLVRAAGGFAPDADRDRVNLAAPLTDGERVWVPARGQQEVPDVVAGAGQAGPVGADGPGGVEPTAEAPLDLNAATAAQLDALPGVGPATASAILAYRDRVGRFASVDDLLEVRGIGDAKLEQIRPLVRV